MAIEKNTAIVQRYVDECWNKKNVPLVYELVARGCPHHMNGPVNFKGRNGFKGALEAWFKAFPDIQITIEDEVAEGDKIALRWKLKATHQGELYFDGMMPSAIPPTGKHVEIEGMSISRIADGRIVEHWDVVDFNWIQQLGQS
jgi:predicted ester cyclase